MKYKKSYRAVCIIHLLLFIFTINAQNTLGTVYYDSDASDALTLFTVHKKTYLINNCGETINQWTSEYTPGNAVYLLKDGSILRAGKTNSNALKFGGIGGVVEKFNWEGDLIWQFFYDTENYRQHHDVYPMPNGNVLILAVNVVNRQEAIANGRSPVLLSSDKIFNERIVEVQPSGFNEGNVVWEWSFFDHIIQDLDPSKLNYGTVADHPELVDFNYVDDSNGSIRWLHINSMQYYEKFDQIVLSSRLLNEIYIIDHSTTTSEAASSMGGSYGKGGDFLYRWGNPQVYDHGDESDRLLGGQHDAHFIPDGLIDEGQMLLFNNYFTESRDKSAVYMLNIPQSQPGIYIYNDGIPYGPTAPSHIYENGTEFFSPIVSSAQRLSNGNLLFCEGRTGKITEVNQFENILWTYIIPVDSDNGERITQGEDVSSITNLTFRAKKYSQSYEGFIGRDLTPGEPIELNPNISDCQTLSLETRSQASSIKIHPNPSTGMLNISTNFNFELQNIVDLKGKSFEINSTSNILDLSTFQSGVYFLRIKINNEIVARKIILY